MSLRYLPFFLLLFNAACNPTPKPAEEQLSTHHNSNVDDEEFKEIFAQSMKYYHTRPPNYDSALLVLQAVLPGLKSNDKAANRAKALNLIGVFYDIKGMYDSAAYNLYEALRLAEAINHDSLLISINSNLGILQFEMNNANEAIKFYGHSLAIAEKMKDSVSIAKMLNNIGNAYMTLLSDFENAIPFFERCMQISASIDYFDG
jgi:tetratricopeptide (TPR) repeat protein